MLKTGNETTDSLIGVRFTGNVIHQNWYKTILMDNGKPDAISIMILADIVYWYRPSEIRDEITGRTIGFSKKFKSDLLQRTYESFSEQMGFTKRQVQESIKRLVLLLTLPDRTLVKFIVRKFISYCLTERFRASNMQ